MTKNNYSTSTVEELIHDQDFIDFAKKVSNEDWQKFLSEHPDNQENIERANKIVSTFHVHHGELDTERKNKLWANIHSFQQSARQNTSRSILTMFLRVAASLALVFCLGGAIYYCLNTNNLSYQFSKISVIEDTENSMVVLSTGETVELKSEQSTISVLDKQETIKIDNDTIITSKSVEETIKNKKIRLTEVIVPFGNKTKLTLIDGTKVWLNAGSRLAFPQKFADKHRTVFLDGEGYFEVVKNENKPFVVSSKNMNIKVFGTKFNVSSYRDDNFSEIVLLEGSVKVWGRNKLVNEKVILTPNEIANYNVCGKEMKLHSDENCGKFISWINGWYEFDNVALEKVFTKLERYYDVNIDFEPAVVRNALPISGKLDLKDSIDDVMFVLARVAEVNYKINNEKIVITR